MLMKNENPNIRGTGGTRVNVVRGSAHITINGVNDVINELRAAHSGFVLY